MFGGHVFQQTIDMYMGTSCANLFLYSYEPYFIQETKKLIRSFNSMLRYIDDAVLIHNSKFVILFIVSIPLNPLPEGVPGVE